MATTKKIRRLFYTSVYGGLYVLANSLEDVKRWGWLEDVTGNPHHETEYQNFERAHDDKCKTEASDPHFQRAGRGFRAGLTRKGDPSIRGQLISRGFLPIGRADNICNEVTEVRHTRADESGNRRAPTDAEV